MSESKNSQLKWSVSAVFQLGKIHFKRSVKMVYIIKKKHLLNENEGVFLFILRKILEYTRQLQGKYALIKKNREVKNK